jgi:RecB family exonuclease
VGVVDRVDRSETTGELVVVDYKTGKAPNVGKYSLATQARIIDEKVRVRRLTPSFFCSFLMKLQNSSQKHPDDHTLCFLWLY